MLQTSLICKKEKQHQNTIKELQVVRLPTLLKRHLRSGVSEVLFHWPLKRFIQEQEVAMRRR